MAKLGEANVGGRLVPAWLLDTPSSVLDGSFMEFSATSKDETYESFCSRLDTLISTWPNKHYRVISLYPPEIWGTGNLQLGWLVKYSKDYIVFTTLTNYDKGQCGWRMIKSGGVWSPLEWFNPPMSLNREYRTTERFQGKPVYVMTKDYGPVQEQNTYKAESIPENADYGWVVNGMINYYGIPIPSWNDDGTLRFGAQYERGSGIIRFVANEDRVNPNARYVLTIKYIKETD